jgi:hypothetical protein
MRIVAVSSLPFCLLQFAICLNPCDPSPFSAERSAQFGYIATTSSSDSRLKNKLADSESLLRLRFSYIIIDCDLRLDRRDKSQRLYSAGLMFAGVHVEAPEHQSDHSKGLSRCELIKMQEGHRGYPLMSDDKPFRGDAFGVAFLRPAVIFEELQ